MKKCCRCRRKKDDGDFYKDSRASDGLYSACKLCHNFAKTKKKLTIQDIKYIVEWYPRTKIRWVIKGKIFDTAREAAKHHNTTLKTIYIWCKGYRQTKSRITASGKKFYEPKANCYRLVEMELDDLAISLGVAPFIIQRYYRRYKDVFN